MTGRDDGVVTASDQAFARAQLDRVAERCYRERATHLFGYARRLGLDSPAAEDAVQEAFTRLLRESMVPVDPAAWLFRTIHNLAVDRHRAASRRLRTTTATDTGTVGVPDADGDANADAAAVWAEVDRLAERQRAAIYLRYRADLDYAAIGRILGITEGGARADVFRALEHLREWMVER
jgi:RNA polymerase sigma factor (sigma-70 family)